MENIITEILDAKERAKRWYYENREKVLLRAKEKYKENPDAKKKMVKEYREKNLEKCRERENKYHKEHPEKYAEIKRRHFENNRDDYGERSAEWMRQHPEYARDKQRKRRAVKKNVSGGHFTEKEWQELLEKTGHKCLCCGKTGVKLERDHVIPIILGEPNSDEISNIQPLCRSCNSKKGTKTIDFR